MDESQQIRFSVWEVLEFVEQKLPRNNGVFYYSCVKCGNIKKWSKEDILHHLCYDGICKNYTAWVWHGEVDKHQNATSQMDEVDEYMDDRLEDMIRDIGDACFIKYHIYDTLCSDDNAPLYMGCTCSTWFYALLKLFNLKEKLGMKVFKTLFCIMIFQEEKLTQLCYLNNSRTTF